MKAETQFEHIQRLEAKVEELEKVAYEKQT